MSFSSGRCFCKLFDAIPVTKLLKRKYGSALYIPRSKATEICVTVQPHIDLEERLKNVDLLKDNLRLRHLSDDVEKIRDVWDFYTNILQITERIQHQKVEVIRRLKELQTDAEKNGREVAKLEVKLKMVKEDLQNLKTTLGALEENCMLQALKVPNVLHPQTPKTKNVELYSHLAKPNFDFKIKHHLDLATELKLVKFNSPHNYYLLNEAAVYELAAKFYFSAALKSSGYFQFSNPDFTKSAVVEGCGLNHCDPDSVFILHEDEVSSEDVRLHLTGGGSLTAFMAYFTRNILPSPGVFPLRYFTLGRQYRPVPKKSELGLLRVSQAAVVEVFCAVHDDDLALNDRYEEIANTAIDVYRNLGYHFKVFHIAAPQLASWESLRLSIQMYSPFFKHYMEVGNLSISDSYISKRLQFCYRDKDQIKFPKIISGTVLNVPKLLACVIEQQGEEFKMPSVFTSD